MDRGAWWGAVHGVPKSQTQLSDFTFTFNPVTKVLIKRGKCRHRWTQSKSTCDPIGHPSQGAPMMLAPTRSWKIEEEASLGLSGIA